MAEDTIDFMLRYDYYVSGVIEVVVYDEKYPDQVELTVQIDPATDPLSQIRGQMITYFGYGNRETKWSEYFDTHIDDFVVDYQGTKMGIMEFIEKLREIEVPRELPPRHLFLGMTRVGGQDYIIVKDPVSEEIEYLTYGKLKPSLRPERKRGKLIGFGRYKGEMTFLWRGKRRIIGYTSSGRRLSRREIEELLERWKLK